MKHYVLKNGAHIRPVKTQNGFSNHHFASWHKQNLIHYSLTLPAYSIPVFFKNRLFAIKSSVCIETQELYIFILKQEIPNAQCPRLLVRDDGVCRVSHEQLFVSFSNSFINRAHLHLINFILSQGLSAQLHLHVQILSI